ncbi:carboxypeptidase-like regulatory domain-containing protein [Blastopirellula sp. JC732]|uniref:Carboxypeptidase-like regulatory domain-containing protein n=1 Tax=Blastopirellula sediminis TaxID=2894196 RepID=A0A9X1MN93_9BACT|nr:carboxypeptidase-like regulatory domain-containing protein [Blastopirellula sediminis]MCC9606802.1 carboxypeptidase-like regulatory domain-containing protein [Blastopirellula sediminis]MCC9629901.1 carboxypeptidase-like regulatory domain-containing protein [Blastopirellula sediminis]
MSIQSTIRIGSLFLLLSVIGGCGSDAGMLKTEYVAGIVTLDGAPVQGATVMFSPTTKEVGTPANGFTNAAGRYELTVVMPGAGMSAPINGGTLSGEYMVSIAKSTAEETPEDGPVAPKMPKLTYHVPKKYSNPRTSGLTATVSAGKNDIPFELSSK